VVCGRKPFEKMPNSITIPQSQTRTPARELSLRSCEGRD
jgi:hypothetical protein